MTQVKFESIPIKDNNEPLVDLATYPFVLETVYHDRGVSELTTHYLRKRVAEKLLKVQESFDGNYHLKILDSWRPREVQDALFQEFRGQLAREHAMWSTEKLDHMTEQFVTKATASKRIPPHATGGTVDLTLVDQNGNEIDMGTAFDHFGPEAAPGYFDNRNEEVAANRKLLANAMVAHGFTGDEDEWWHFDYGCQLWAVRSGQPQAIYGEASLSL